MSTSDEQQPQWSRSRYDDIKACSLDPTSLVGSYFHRLDGAERLMWQGIVVGEPQPGIYLVQLFDWVGERGHQRVVTILDITQGDGEWRFYDTEEWMALAYERPSSTVEHDRIGL
jgi:hypothetical protein